MFTFVLHSGILWFKARQIHVGGGGGAGRVGRLEEGLGAYEAGNRKGSTDLSSPVLCLHTMEPAFKQAAPPRAFLPLTGD